MRYEITIRELEAFTPEEEDRNERRNGKFDTYPADRYSDKSYHEVRVLHAQLSREEFEAVKKAVIGAI